MADRGAVARGKLSRLHHRQEAFLRRHRDIQGQVRDDLWRTGVEHVRRMKVAAALAAAGPKLGRSPAAVVFAGVQWRQVGPAPIRIDADRVFQGVGPVAGEVTDIAIDPTGTTDQIIYIATNDGGIWKSTDGGATWNPKTDGMPSLSMGAVAIDPVNSSIVYAGTGNLFDGGGVFSKGVGVYKSTDAGETWAIVGGAVLSGLDITRIVLPASNVLLVATNSGLFRSVDGGANFGNNAPPFNNGLAVQNGSISCLSLDTASPTTVYVGVRGTGLFVSTDSGATFPTNLLTNPGGPTGSFDFIAFSQSVSPDNKTMFASIADPSVTPSYKGLFKSTDRGATWTVLADAAARAAENGGLQPGYDVTVGVDPQNADRVYIGFQEVYLSTNGGTNFGTPAISRSKIHFDQHAVVFSPLAHASGPSTKLYVATDGGLSTTSDGGNNWTNLNEGVATSLFRGIDIGRGSPANNQFTIGGTQDCGTIEHQSAFAAADWHLAIDGDGGHVAVDPSNPLRAYGVDDGQFIVTSDGGRAWSTPQPLPVTSPPLGGLLAFLMAIDPNNTVNVYVSESTNFGFAPGPRLFKSTNSAASFSLLQSFPASISALATTPLNSSVLWVGLSNGSAQLSSDGGSTWTPISVTGAPAANSIEGIAIDPTDANTVVVVYSGFTTLPATNRTKHVFRTTDNGVSWTDISGTDGGYLDTNLPDLPLHSVVIDGSVIPHRIIVATDSAVMQSGDNGATWQVLGVGLPTVDCLSLAFDGAATPPVLRVGTYGRSAFELTRPSGQTIAVISNLAFGAVALGATAVQTVRLFNVGSAVLTISGFNRLSGGTDFQLVTPPAFPLSVNPGTEVDFTVQFQPSVAGNQPAVFQITSDDPSQPALNLNASGSTPFPVVSGLNPSSGAAAGGDRVTLTGSGFTGATAVNFGANAATAFTVNSDTQISSTSPAGTGTVDITVL